MSAEVSSVCTGTLPRYLPGLDGVRAVAACAVLLCHAVACITCWSPAWNAAHPGQEAAANRLTQAFGAAGVGLFFVLSGLCIHLPAARTLALGGALRTRWADYFRRRFKRIYPTHLLALALSVGVAALLPLASRGVHAMVSRLTWGQALAHVFLVHTFVPGAFFSGNQVLWSIATEAHFYLLYPLLLLARGRVSMGKLVVALFLASVCVKLGAKALHLPDAWKMILIQSFVCRMWEWALGAYLAERLVTSRSSPVWGLGTVLAALTGMALLGAALRAYLPFGEVLQAAVWPPLFAWLIWSATRMRLSPQSATAHVGRASFSLYLVHPMALAVSLYFLRTWSVPAWVEFTVSLAACAVLTGAYFLLVERAFLNSPNSTAAPKPALDPARPLGAR